MRSFPPGSMNVICSRIVSAAAAANVLASPKRSNSSGPATAWSYGSWIGSDDRCLISLATVTDLKTRGIGFRSLTELMDTTTRKASSCFMFSARLRNSNVR